VKRYTLGKRSDSVKHIIFYSGGIGSWMSAKRVIQQNGKENVELLFTDTFIEDEDLYRFLIETAADVYGVSDIADLVERALNTPEMDHPLERKEHLLYLAKDTMERIPAFHWIADGRDVWEVLNDKKFMSNSRIAHCSEYLKQKAARVWVKKHLDPTEWTMHLGIDWTETHRKAAPVKNWAPYPVEFPMCEEPFMSKDEMIAELNALGIETPKLYRLGFVHNNCGGFCVRAGQGHFKRLLETMPERYAYHEQREQDLMKLIEEKMGEGYIKTMMKDQSGGTSTPLSMKDLREKHEKEPQQIDIFDIGGCGCFVNYNE
jgi:hypothetical protein